MVQLDDDDDVCRLPSDDDYDDDNATTSDTRSTMTQETAPTQNAVKEVLYENATELFRAVEAGQWEEVLKFCRDDSPQLKVWVKNQGSENTTFEWSLWKRLPLHEACRRQPPAWLISAMLQAYPEAAKYQTHFGQTPLHLAVDTGASPEVVNLLIVSNWHAVLHSDNSGRTPLEILLDGMEFSTLEKQDQVVVQASLERSTKALEMIHSKCDARLKEQQDGHERELRQVHDKHKRELQYEHERQACLEKSLETIEGLVVSLKEEMRQMEEQIAAHELKDQEWKVRTSHYQGRLQNSQAENAAHLEHVAALKDLVSKKDANIHRLERQIKQLQNDLISIARGHDDKLMLQYNALETNLRVMLESQVKLKSRLSGHSKALHALIKERGITMPPPKQREEKKEDPEPLPDTETPQIAAEAANAAAAAALAALKLTDHEVIV